MIASKLSSGAWSRNLNLSILGDCVKGPKNNRTLREDKTVHFSRPKMRYQRNPRYAIATGSPKAESTHTHHGHIFRTPISTSQKVKAVSHSPR